jgi:protein tyrosine phosphatase
MLKKPEEQISQGDAGAGAAVHSTFSAHDIAARKRVKEITWIDKFLDKKNAMLEAQPPTAGMAAPLPALERTVRAAPPAALSVERLLALPSSVSAQLAALELTRPNPNTVSEALVRDIWIAIESNTRALGPDWGFIDNAGAGPAEALEAAPGGAGQLVLHRFSDILAPRRTAIEDAVRSQRHGLRHYLHANRVDLKCGRSLIASQKPLSAEIAGFQQMLAEHNVALVVDLTREVEQDLQDDYAVPRPKTPLSAASPRRVDLLPAPRNGGGESRAMLQVLTIRHAEADHLVQRLHFTGWPDHGVIPADALIALADRVEQLSPDPARAVVVHCMAGVGRSGTLLSFLATRRRIAAAMIAGQPATAALVLRTVMEVVARGRIDRSPSFVQMEEQFHLVVQALMKDSAAGLDRVRSQPVAALPARRSAWRRALFWLGLTRRR